MLFMAITLVVGMLWGRLTWGVFWEWDARLTTTAFLFVTYIGYLAVRRLGGTPRAAGPAQRACSPCSPCSRSRSSTSASSCGAACTRTPPCCGPDGDVKMDGLMLFTLFVGIVAFTLLYVWLVIHRQRTLTAEDAARRRPASTWRSPNAERAGAATVEVLMEDAGFILGSYVVTFGAIAAYAALRAAPRPAGRRRSCPTRPSPGREALTDVSRLDLSPRPTPGSARPAPHAAHWAPIVVLGARARRRRRDRHPVPRLGGRLLLQRRRDRRPRRLRGRPPAARPGHRRRGHASRRTAASRRSRSSFGDAAMPVRYEGEPGGIFEECEPVVVHGELVDGTFEGDQVEVKHSNEYEAENADRLDASADCGVRRTCSPPA